MRQRAREREEYDQRYGMAAASSSSSLHFGGGKRTWDELDREEKEREWALYERDRARDDDRYARDRYEETRYHPRSRYDERPYSGE